jgi:Protein of unknown function (DUF3572)
MKTPRSMPTEAAEALAIQALSYIAGEPERLERFLAITGVGVDQIREAAGEPGFLAGVLAYLASDEQLAAAFTADAGCGPADIARAHNALGGEPWEREIP